MRARIEAQTHQLVAPSGLITRRYREESNAPPQVANLPILTSVKGARDFTHSSFKRGDRPAVIVLIQHGETFKKADPWKGIGYLCGMDDAIQEVVTWGDWEKLYTLLTLPYWFHLWAFGFQTAERELPKKGIDFDLKGMPLAELLKYDPFELKLCKQNAYYRRALHQGISYYQDNGWAFWPMTPGSFMG